jgi:hypothetical protein
MKLDLKNIFLFQKWVNLQLIYNTMFLIRIVLDSIGNEKRLFFFLHLKHIMKAYLNSEIGIEICAIK